MYTQETSNIKLTLEQLQQLAEVETRLANLNSEIKGSNRILVAAKNDCDRITKEKEYKEELLNTVTIQLKEKEDAITRLNELHLETTAKLHQLNTEIEEKTKTLSEKEMSLKDREDAVKTAEGAHQSKETALMKRHMTHSSAEEDFNKKVAKLKEVLKDF